MEPGHEDREEVAAKMLSGYGWAGPQWSPVTRTGKRHPRLRAPQQHPAAMEPGHEDREEGVLLLGGHRKTPPQWSPVTRTGKSTCRASAIAN